MRRDIVEAKKCVKTNRIFKNMVSFDMKDGGKLPKRRVAVAIFKDWSPHLFEDPSDS